MSTQPGGGIAAERHDLVSISARPIRQGLHETPRGASSAQGGWRFHMVDDQSSGLPAVSREHGFTALGHFQTAKRYIIMQATHESRL